MATIRCTVDEYHKFVGPRIRNVIQNLTRPRKRKLDGRCEGCGEKVSELDAAHLPGQSRIKIVTAVLSEFSAGDGSVRGDLAEIERRIVAAHTPVEAHFRMLCKTCHLKLPD
jgi:hypothetical protein